MRVFIAVIGSGGDLNPMLAVGMELRRRGHAVKVLAGAWQEESVRACGLDFQEVLSREDFARFDTGTWVAFFRELVMPAMSSVYTCLDGQVVPGETVLIGSSHTVGLRLLEEKHGVPLVTVRLQPKPAAPQDASPEALAGFHALFAPQLNRFRRRIGLPAIHERFDQWLVALERAVAFFPPWFPQPHVDAPEQGRMVDFILSDPGGEPAPDPKLDAFLAGQELPILFTYGTGNESVGRFFAVAEQACARLGRPAVFLTRYRDKLPANLPRHVLHVSYMPFERLLSGVELIVYHGGIGTCAQALRAGIPQMVMPIGFDQHQNAARVEALGVGLRFEDEDPSPERLAGGLDAVLQSRTIRARCREVCRHFLKDDAVERCCDEIESLARH